MVKNYIEGKIYNKFTEINVHYKSTRNRNLLLKLTKIRFAK